MAKHKLMNPKQVKRAKRVAAFALAAGLVSPGAGAWMNDLGIAQIDAVASAIFGAVIALTGLVTALLMTYASKDEGVTDADFDTHINAAIENLRSKSKKEDK